MAVFPRPSPSGGGRKTPAAIEEWLGQDDHHRRRTVGSCCYLANSIAAVEAGASRIDAAAAGLGAGAGNTPMEVFVAVCERMGVETGVDVFKISDVAEDLVTPIMDMPIRIDRDALTLGYAGVYSSFLLFAKRAEANYGVPAREILVELGRRGTVGGQEDMIEDLALDLARQKAATANAGQPGRHVDQKPASQGSIL